MPPVVDKNKCTKCEICAQICPLDVIKVEVKNQEKEIVVKYPEECWHCRACAIDCPMDAIDMRYPLSHMMLHIAVPNDQGGEQTCK